ncbi:hypothetical protein PRJ_2122 [Pseudomonas sp. XWY-1]|uniref:hypothetical protein n=1 Tax=Pseudomonas sp. XWY-1 TaxID=2069256 RepID=UPI000CDCDA7E|nr:hypothetical protein [Pseudomonas sp. XWY-1]AUZ58725.1 hypothetical protein PRJ_2122 [Pseudomonas sp. XWY-1]
MRDEWIYDGTDMSLRDYLGAAIAKQEPGVTLSDCTHSFTANELNQIVNAQAGMTLFRFDDDAFVFSNQVWSERRVYFIPDDTKQLVRSVPRNPPV